MNLNLHHRMRTEAITPKTHQVQNTRLIPKESLPSQMQWLILCERLEGGIK